MTFFAKQAIAELALQPATDLNPAGCAWIIIAFIILAFLLSAAE